MRFKFTEQQEAFREEVNGFLHESLPADWEGADNAIDDEAYEFRTRVPEEAGAEEVDRAGVAGRVRRARPVAVGPGRLQRGDGLRTRADRQHGGRRVSRADDHPLRQRRAEEAAPAGHHVGRRDLVPGVQRAEQRQRPRVAADARGRGRRRLHHQRPEDLDVAGALRRLDVPARAHGSRTRRSTAASATSCST